jgi:hypothetical protein
MANNIVTATVRVRGTRALLWHKFGPDALPLEKKERTGVAGNDPEEWKRTVTYDPETRQLYLDPTYAFACLRDASKHTRKGKGSIQSMVSATLQVVDERILFTVEFDKTIVAREQMSSVLIDAGKLVGLGNGRSIGFGRFEVVEFDIAGSA